MSDASQGADNSSQQASLGELRLRVLKSLPERHIYHLHMQMLQNCRAYLRQHQDPDSEISAEELLSEIWKKLVGSVSTEQRVPAELLKYVTIDNEDPGRDGRIAWLLESTGGTGALRHRCEDIRRERHGRSSKGGRPLTQVGEETPEMSVEPDEIESGLVDADAEVAWQGLLLEATRRFPSGDDVSLLLRLMNQQSEIFSGNRQWPISDIAGLLNRECAVPTWTNERVDNAKRRLAKWVQNMCHSNGFGIVELEALFAKAARDRGITRRPVDVQRHDLN